MVRKFLAILFILSILSQVVVFADNLKIDVLEINNQIVTIRGESLAGKDQQITMKVTKKDINLNKIDAIYGVFQMKTDENSKFSFEFEIPDSKNSIISDGNYVISLKAPNEEILEQEFEFIGKKRRQETVDKIKKCCNSLSKESSKEEVRAVFAPILADNESSLKAMGLNMDYFKALSEALKEDTIYTFFKYCDSENLTIENMNDFFKKSMGLCLFNSGNKKDGIKFFNPCYRNISYSEIKDDNQKNYIDSFMQKTYLDIPSFENSYAQANGYYFLGNARVENILEILTDNKITLGFEDTYFSKILSLTSLKKNIVCEYIISHNNGIKDSSSLNVVIKDAYDTAVFENGSPNFGGTNSSSSGGSSFKTDKPVVKEEIKTIEFTDMKDFMWANDAVNYLAKKGVLLGTGNGKFEPNRNISREEFVKMIVLASEVAITDKDCDFSDVKKDGWYYKYIAIAYEKGFIKGIDERKFGISAPITREDMAVIVYRVSEFCNIKLEKVREYDAFIDDDEISAYARDSIKHLYCANKLNGQNNNTFNPKASTTRAEAAKLTYDILVAK